MNFAYLDPVTGSAILQVLLGALAVLGLGWQYVRKAFTTMFRRTSSPDNGEGEKTATPTTSEA